MTKRKGTVKCTIDERGDHIVFKVPRDESYSLFEYLFETEHSDKHLLIYRCDMTSDPYIFFSDSGHSRTYSRTAIPEFVCQGYNERRERINTWIDGKITYYRKCYERVWISERGKILGRNKTAKGRTEAPRK